MKNRLGRRNLLKLLGMTGIGTISGLFSNVPSVLAAATNISADDALDLLMKGNHRFTQQQSEYPHQGLKRLQEVAYTQHPYATILSCADSRVPAELIFDAGIGDLFDIRVAGNIVTPEVLGSIEYAVFQLNTPLIVVLGHERCGAITATVKGGKLPGSIGTLVAAIQPGIDFGAGFSDESIEKAVVANVSYQIKTLKRNSPLIVERISRKKLQIVGGRYDLDSGQVEII
jgi:carbonic anhydrase